MASNQMPPAPAIIRGLRCLLCVGSVRRIRRPIYEPLRRWVCWLTRLVIDDSQRRDGRKISPAHKASNWTLLLPVPASLSGVHRGAVGSQKSKDDSYALEVSA